MTLKESFQSIGAYEMLSTHFDKIISDCKALGKSDFGTFMGAIIEASIASGAKYFFIEQAELYGRDVFGCLKTSRDNLRKFGYEIK